MEFSKIKDVAFIKTLFKLSLEFSSIHICIKELSDMSSNALEMFLYSSISKEKEIFRGYTNCIVKDEKDTFVISSNSRKNFIKKIFDENLFNKYVIVESDISIGDAIRATESYYQNHPDQITESNSDLISTVLAYPITEPERIARRDRLYELIDSNF